MLNVLAYILCLAIGYLRVISPTTTVILTVGLLITTFIRAVILVRFDTLYAAGPARWRNLFFIATLLGAVWWGVILVSFTLGLGMLGETPLLWMYSIIFFASTLQATSPYRRFSRIYLCVALLPPTVAALSLATIEGYMYSVMMLVFVLLLSHQIEVMSSTYWERLEANFSLRQKARKLESEKRDVDVSVSLNTQFLTALGHEFRVSLNDILGGISLLSGAKLDAEQKELILLTKKAAEQQLDLVNNIVDFAKINSRQLCLENTVVNLRSQFQQWVEEASADAHRHNVEMDFEIAESVPSRVSVDGIRVGQIFKNLLTHAIAYSEHGSISVMISFKSDSQTEGLLEVDVIDYLDSENSELDISDKALHSENTSHARELWFTIGKALAECLGGSLLMDRIPNKDTSYRLCVPLQVLVQSGSSILSKFSGQKVLLLDHQLPLTVHQFEQFAEWSLQCARADDFAHARTLLNDQNADCGLLLINLSQAEEQYEVIEFLRYIKTVSTQPLGVILLLSHTHIADASLRPLWEQNDKVFYLLRPIAPQRLHALVAHILEGAPMPLDESLQLTEATKAKHYTVLVVDDHRVNQMVAQGMLKRLGYDVQVANNGVEGLEAFQKITPDLVLMDCQMPEMDGFEASRCIRNIQQESDVHTPILAMTAHSSEEDQARCYKAGMDGVLCKPLRLEELEVQLTRWLGSDDESN